MRTRLIKIGNSKGVRLPQTLIKQFELQGEIIIEPVANGLLLTSATSARNGWEEQFKSAVVSEKDSLANWKDAPNKFDKEDWTW